LDLDDFYAILPLLLRFFRECVGNIELLSFIVSMINPSRLNSICNGLLCGHFRIFGTSLDEFILNSVGWDSFEQWAAWMFLDAEIKSHKDCTNLIIHQLIKNFDRFVDPENILGVKTIFTNVNLTDELFYEFMISNTDSTIMTDIIGCYMSQYEPKQILQFVMFLLSKFTQNGMLADMLDDETTETSSNVEYMLINLGKMIAISEDLIRQGIITKGLVLYLKFRIQPCVN
jgi:hypothetical protein